MNLLTRVVALPALLVLPGLAHAAPWKGEAGLGILATSGNSDTQSINGKFVLDWTSAPWKNELTGTAINNGDEDGRTAERYTASDKLDWSFTALDYLFGSVDWEKDRFGGYNERMTETAGYGRHLLTGPVHFLDAEIGAGWRQQEEQDTGDKQNDPIVRGAVKYVWTLSDTSSFGEAVKVETGKDNTFTESVTELKMTIVGNFAAAISFTYRNNSDVPPDTKKTDTFTAVSLSYKFGS